MQHTWVPAGELEHCHVCGAFEGAMTTHCPGHDVDYDRWQEIYDAGGGKLSAFNHDNPIDPSWPGGINYRDGQWRTDETATSWRMSQWAIGEMTGFNC